MNNCLVTKLKSSVNNESLSKLNVLTIKTKASDSPTLNTQWINIGASGNGSVSVNSTSVGLYQMEGISGPLLPYPQTILANAILNSHFENKDGIIEVTGKYNISTFCVGENGTVRIKEIYGIPGTIEKFQITSIEESEIDATKLANALNRSKISYLTLPTVGITIVNKLSKNTVGEFKALNNISNSLCLLFGNTIGLDDISNNVGANYINIASLNPGNLSSLAKLINVTKIAFSDYKQNNGDIMDFINPWIQAGRTSGKINVLFLLGQQNITLNGQPITYPEGVTNPSAYLNWTSDGTVTFTAS